MNGPKAPTLLSEGWETPYRHPRYQDSALGPFTIYNHQFSLKEKLPIRKLAARDCRTHVMHAPGPVNNFEPLLGIPSPWLVRQKLTAMRAAGVDYLSHFGGMAPPAAVRWQPNHEVFRRFNFDPREDGEQAILSIARDWVGEESAPLLVAAWRLAEKAIRGFMPNPLYFLWGVWYRIWIRPLVPDIEAIPEEERAYYEEHLLSTHHNPGRVDLSRDVLFNLMSPATAAKAVNRIDRHALPPLDQARGLLARHEGGVVFDDLRDRLDALRCWMTTRRNVAAWIAHVHGYLKTRDGGKRAAHRRALSQMVRSEVANTKALVKLLARTRTEIMAVSKGKETTFIYDDRFAGYLDKKIELMRKYGRRVPRIDPNIMWRVRSE